MLVSWNLAWLLAANDARDAGVSVSHLAKVHVKGMWRRVFSANTTNNSPGYIVLAPILLTVYCEDCHAYFEFAFASRLCLEDANAGPGCNLLSVSLQDSLYIYTHCGTDSENL